MTENYAELAEAVGELRTTVEAMDNKGGKGVAELKAKLAKIEPTLDKFEDIAGEYDDEKAKTKTLEDSVATLTEDLESAGTTAEEIKTRCEVLEAEIARKGKALDALDPSAYKGGDEYKAFVDWALQGRAEMNVDMKQLLRTDTAVSGGVLVIGEMETFIMKEIVELDPFRNLARVRVIASKTIEMPVRTSIPTANYEGETEKGKKSTSLYRNETVTPFRQTFTVPITMDMLMDAAFDMEAEIAGDSLEAFAFGEGQGFVTGSGFKDPQGFTVDTRITGITSAVSAKIDGTDIINLIGELKVGYDASLVFNRKTLAGLRVLRADAAVAGDSAGQHLWLPGLSGTVQNTFAGENYTIMPSMANVAGSSKSVAFGDWRRGYVIVDRTGLTTTRDDVTRKEEAIVEFTMHRWNTGQVVIPEAIKILTTKA